MTLLPEPLWDIYIYIYKRNDCHKLKEYCVYTSIELFAVICMLVTQMIYIGEVRIHYVKIIRFCMFLPSSILLVWVFAECKGALTKSINYRMLIKLGNVSAYAYLIHQVTIHYVTNIYYALFKMEISIGTKTFISFAVTIMLSVAYMKYKQPSYISTLIKDNKTSYRTP